MTYGDPVAGATAADLVNTASEETLADMLFSLGEERFARAIARGIVEARANERILTTAQLVEIVKASTPSWYHHRRLNPATKTFQALRIAVNDELGAVRAGLAAAIDRLSEGGRVAVITFHSIEDRVVKNMLRDAVHDGKGILITRKPVAPSEAECARNPRARSAKLRVFERSSAPAV
jgi:16S rRNA (cytosine1402-N4)-methyltransferase